GQKRSCTTTKPNTVSLPTRALSIRLRLQGWRNAGCWNSSGYISPNGSRVREMTRATAVRCCAYESGEEITRSENANLRARPALRRANVDEAKKHHGYCRAFAGVGHRREYGVIQRRGCRAAQDLAGQRAAEVGAV